jgi:hypothetical protein
MTHFSEKSINIEEYYIVECDVVDVYQLFGGTASIIRVE